MAALEVIALDTATPQLRAPGASDTYTHPRQSLFLAGTAAAPGIAGNSDDNTGMLWPAADTVAWATGGSEQMRLTSTGLGIGTNNPVTTLQVGGGSGLRQISISGGGYDLALGASGGTIFGFASQAISTVFNTASVPLGIGTNAAQPLIFGTSATEQMRLDSSGNLGIGTTPSASNVSGSVTVVNVKGNSTAKTGTFIAQSFGTINATNIEMFAADTLDEVGLLTKGASTAMVFYTGSVPDKRMTLDSSGNLGLGVTPSAWSGGRAIEVGVLGNCLWGFGTNELYQLSNAYFNAGFKYAGTGTATQYLQYNGTHQWHTAPSGTAGNAISFTQAMTLDANGNLLVGTITASQRLSVTAASNSGFVGARIQNNNASVGLAGVEFSSDSTYAKAAIAQTRADANGVGPLVFYVASSTGAANWTTSDERARIPAAGGMVVGTAALATNATDGFLYVPTCAGTPTGTPTTQTGTAPIVVDTTNNKLYFYSGGQWRDAGP